MKTEHSAEYMIEVVRNLAEKARNVTEQAEELTRQLRSARGTRDRLPPPAPGPLAPRHYVGDEGPTPELLEAVRALVTDRPMTHQDLLQATGARADRVKGVLMRIQREDGGRLVNLGNEAKALWFIPDEETLKRLRKLPLK